MRYRNSALVGVVAFGLLLAIDRHMHDSAAGAGHLRRLISQPIKGYFFTIHQAAVADQDGTAVNLCS